MRKITVLICSFMFVTALQAQWEAIDWNIHNTNIGYVGIGTSTPRSQLELLHTVRISSSATGSSFFIQGNQLSTTDGWSNVRLVGGSASGSGWLKSFLDNYGGYFSWACNSANGERELMRINADNGNVGIGIDNPQTKLAVNGEISSRKVRVTQLGWPDYVFQPNYKLPTLAEVDLYIKANKHLPDVTPAAEVEAKGLDLGESQAQLLKKIEELTLYAIQQDKQIGDQQQEIGSLKKEVELLKKMTGDMEELRKQIEQIKSGLKK